MCGIVGVFKFNCDGINEDELKTFTASLHHRGPDGSGIYLDDNKRVGLGHTRTITFDMSEAGHQPMSYSDDRYWITFNGEIYNFIELRKELQSLGYTFKSDSDTEVVLAAYAQWGGNADLSLTGTGPLRYGMTRKKTCFFPVIDLGSSLFITCVIGIILFLHPN